MAIQQFEISIQVNGPGLKLITQDIQKALSKVEGNGLVHLHLLHTSASLLIQENTDPTARQDLEEFFARLAPEGQSWHRHLAEGPDDTTSHLKASILPVSLTIPLHDGRMKLGTWQGIYLFEHRAQAHARRIFMTVIN